MERLLRNRESLLFIIIVVMVGLIGLRSPVFLSPGNVSDIFVDTVILMMLACAQLMVLLTAGIDLSVAAVMGFAGMVAALISQQYPETSVVIFILLSTLTGLGVGGLNAIFIVFLKLPPIVVTLGMLSIARGMIFVISDGEWISSHEMSPAFIAFTQGSFLGIKTLIWIGLIVILAFAYVLRYTHWGRMLYAFGGNREASRYVGLANNRIESTVYMVSGAVAGFCGYLWVSRYSVAYTEIAIGFELQVIAACVIGGISITGGVGTVGGAVLGALFLGIVKGALPVIKVSPFWQTGIIGFVILAAIILNTLSYRRPAKIIVKPSASDPPKDVKVT